MCHKNHPLTSNFANERINMPKNSPIPNNIRAKIARNFRYLTGEKKALGGELPRTIKEIAVEYEVSESFVYKLYSKVKKSNWEDRAWRIKHGGGPRKKLNEEHIEALQSLINRNPKANLQDLRESLRIEYGIDVSESTICRAKKKYSLRAVDLIKNLTQLPGISKLLAFKLVEHNIESPSLIRSLGPARIYELLKANQPRISKKFLYRLQCAVYSMLGEKRYRLVKQQENGEIISTNLDLHDWENWSLVYKYNNIKDFLY